MLWIILVILLIVSLGGGRWAYGAYGPGWGIGSPLILILVVIVILYALGMFRGA